MITADRFLARAHTPAWFDYRRKGVSATTVARAATDSGFKAVLADRAMGAEVEDNAYMAFGREQEPFILDYAHHEHGILDNDWLIAAEDNDMHMATPDGFSPDYTLIAEAKTTGKDWGEKIPIQYRRQVQFQLYVSGAERCLFLWQLRGEDDYGDFYPAWLEPKWVWVDRDEDEISKLVATADRLLLSEGF